MNRLSIREKAMLFLGGLTVVIMIFYFGVPWLQEQIGGGETTRTNLAELEKVHALLELRQTAERMESPLRKQVGLQGDRVIPDERLNQIRERANVAPDPENPDRINLNKATINELHALGLDKEQAAAVRKYCTLLGNRFDSVDQLAEIRKGLFEGKDEQAVILALLAKAAQDVGIEPKNVTQIEPRLARSTRPVELRASARNSWITQLYLQELAREAKSIQATLESGDAEQIAQDPQIRWFPTLPEEIPAPWRLKLIEVVRKRGGELGVRIAEKEADTLDEALSRALTAARATREQADVEVLEKGRRGVFGIGQKPVRVRVIHQDPDEGLVAFFRQMQSEETDIDVDRTALEASLADYVRQCARMRYKLAEVLKLVPLSHKPHSYIVEMSVKGDLGKVVQLIQKVESEHKWIRVHGLKISIADEKQTLLQANLTMTASVL